ncbi:MULTISPECIES: FRG domain-containing protein [unclassified Pseudoclavibacter]|uniref:FRG domain-containing protein n=1 Tax=unclassified Pseudoclavibacter TaxID=2615177 RepID=UPI001BAB1699|nr:FRG domain-containing protein [Pseudoclavibacter sp. Marseille-Q4354]
MSTSLPTFTKNTQQRIEHGWNIWTVGTPHELTQISGYLKFRGSGGLSLFRGQASLHSTMSASAFRGEAGAPLARGGVSRHGTALRDYIDEIVGSPCTCLRAREYRYAHECTEKVASKGALINSTHRAAVEPLLQHYGLRTRWIDVVDNIWVALWFACHRQITVGRYAHHSRRSVSQEPASAKAYVFVMSTGTLEKTHIPGYSLSSTTRFVDLRYCVPSLYLRPHAQHGALIAPLKLDLSAPRGSIGSLSSSVEGVLEVDLNDALSWLGQGVMTSAAALFPPATYDEGYRLLLDNSPMPGPALGHLTAFGPAE